MRQQLTDLMEYKTAHAQDQTAGVALLEQFRDQTVFFALNVDAPQHSQSAERQFQLDILAVLGTEECL